jgi:hypothetical protein
MRKLIALACLAALGGCVIVTPGPGVSYASSGFGADVVDGNGVTAREERQVASLAGLEVGGVAHVDVRVGPAPSLVVEADSNLLPLIRTDARGDRLVIGTEGAFRTRNPIHIIYTVPQLTDLHVGGAGRINVTGLNGAALKVRQGGSGAVELAGDAARRGSQRRGPLQEQRTARGQRHAEGQRLGQDHGRRNPRRLRQREHQRRRCRDRQRCRA